MCFITGCGRYVLIKSKGFQSTKSLELRRLVPSKSPAEIGFPKNISGKVTVLSFNHEHS